MKTIEFRCKVITPMFLGGAYGRNAELRPPSIKGAMRFWWRAINTSIGNLQELYKKEKEIFGGTDENSQKSTFVIKVKHNMQPTTNSLPTHNIRVQTRQRNFQINILDYLAYGTYERQHGGNVFIRKYFMPGGEFNIIFIVKDTAFLKDILISFYFLVTFGGLGSKVRNGFGGFVVEQIYGDKDLYQNILGEQYQRFSPSRNILHQFNQIDSIPPYTGFSKHIKLFRTRNTFTNWDGALAELGRIYKSCRERLENRHSYQKRQYIGAPLDPPRENFKSFLERHAKPYFMKVTKENRNSYRGYVLYLPSRYCEGLNKDRNDYVINHEQVNQQFNQVCKEFNSLLSESLEEVTL